MNTEEEKIEQPSFLDDYPHLKPRWDYARNSAAGIHPEKYSRGSDKKVWWKCTTGHPCHVTLCTIGHMTERNTPCGFCKGRKFCTCGCNSLESVAPDRMKAQWDEEQNGSMKLYPQNSDEYVWWKCDKGFLCHKWQARIRQRVKSKLECSYCLSHVLCECGCNTLMATATDILREEWDEEKNGPMSGYAPNSNTKVHWNCSVKKCHHWTAVISSRTGNGNGCPKCHGLSVCENGCACNSLFFNIRNPLIPLEWDEKANGSMKNYAKCSNIVVSWICSSGIKCHVFQLSINQRNAKVGGHDCKFCHNQEVCPCFCNSLETRASDILKKEWVEEKNGPMTGYVFKSTKRAYWRCELGHEWECMISTRTRDNPTGCSKCNNNKSTLNEEFEKVCQELDLTFKREFSFKDTRHVQKLNYDFVIEYKSKIIRVELQGYQHFDSLAHFYSGEKPKATFATRVIIDNKKSFNSIKAGHYFLSISDLAIKDIKTILENFIISMEKSEKLFARYFITKEFGLQYRNGKIKNIITDEALLDDKILLRYQVYKLHCDSLVKNSLENVEPFVVCEKSGRAYLESMLETHYLTEKHKTCKKKKIKKTSV